MYPQEPFTRSGFERIDLQKILKGTSKMGFRRNQVASPFIRRAEYLPCSKPHIRREEIRNVVGTLRRGWLTMGPLTQELEEKFARHIGTEYGVAVSNGTAALFLALKAWGIGRGDEVITTPLTFCATANAIELAGARVVFADVSPETATLDPREVKGRITKKTRAILPVHLYGEFCDMDTLLDIGRQHDLKVIEDAAHCASGAYKGKRAGSLGDVATFSFYASKNLTTGEGGMAATNSLRVAEYIRLLRYHGLRRETERWDQQHTFTPPRLEAVGFNFVMTDVAAAIGLGQLKRLHLMQRKRKRLWQFYLKELTHLAGIIVPQQASWTTEHGMHLFTIRLHLDELRCTRDQFVSELHQNNIGGSVHYPAIHLEPYYRNTYGYREGMFPNAEAISKSTVTLPLFPGMGRDDANDVIRTLEHLLDRHRL